MALDFKEIHEFQSTTNPFNVNNAFVANPWSFFLVNATNNSTNLTTNNNDNIILQNNQTFSIWPLCTEIEQTLRKPAYLLILRINLAILAITLICTAFLIQKFIKERIIVHGNLLV